MASYPPIKGRKAYIAGPLATQAEREFLERVNHTMESVHGLKTFLPHRDSQGSALVVDGAEMGDTASRGIFTSNVEALSHCDFVVAVLDRSTGGTSWEVGYAYGRQKAIIGVLTDYRGSASEMACSLMHRWSVNKMVHSTDELSEYMFQKLDRRKYREDEWNALYRELGDLGLTPGEAISILRRPGVHLEE